MITGIILRGVGSFYDVVSDGEIHRCRARGKFRKLGLTPMVGDHVVIDGDRYNRRLSRDPAP
jgi:ribosome biogenesis GTPase